MSPNSSYKTFILTAAFISFVGGLLVIIGWYSNIESLKSVFPGLATMKFNTALCFILAGIVLFFYDNKSKAGGILLSLISLTIILIGTISLSEDIFGYTTGLDQFFIADIFTNTNKAFNFPGRMAMPSSLAFILLGFSSLFFRSSNINIRKVSQVILHIITLIATIAIIGYMYKIPVLYKLSLLSSMALHTSVIFFIVSVCASLINPTLGITGLFTGSRIGSIMARRLFPLITVLIIILGLLRLESHYYNLVSVEFGITLFTLSFLLVTLFLISYTAKYLDRIDIKRDNAEKALSELNKNLEKNIAERTEDLRTTSQRLSLATESSKMGIWDWDIINNKLIWDERMYQLYGITSSTFSGAYDAWVKGLHPDDKEAGNRAIEKAIAGNEDFDIEFRVLWPDKSVHYIKGNGLVQRDANGKGIRIIGTNWDVTERKKAEAKFRNLLESAPDAMVIVNKEGVMQLVNAQVEKIFGYTKKELIGQKVELLIPKRFVGNHSHHRSDFFANPKSRKMGAGLELFGVKKNGEEFPVEISLSPLETEEGILVSAAIRDITDRKKAEELNKEQEEKIKLFVKHTPAAIAMFDNELRYIVASDRWYKDYGIEGKLIIGELHYDIFPEIRKMPEWLEKHQRCLKGYVEINEESPFPRPDGKIDWLHWEIHPWRKHDGSIGGIIMFTEVITEKIKAREKLNQLNEQLVSSNSELEQFAYVASHDLQEPLRMVSSFLQLLELKYKPQLDETAIKYINFAVDGADRMKTLIQDLLAFSKVGLDKEEWNEVNIVKIISETKQVLKKTLTEKNVVIRAGALPVITANSQQISQIFQNLIANAVKYNESENPVVEINAEETDNHWLFSIKDNGIGIEEEYFEKIFEVFQRLHTRTEYTGTGIGLAICKKIAENHQGKIWVTSVKDEGTTFYFTISKNLKK